MSDNATTIKLGEFEFDPVKTGETSDFRLGIEGVSGSGKTNTTAVLIEDLGKSPIPMLVLERLSLLSPVREEVENFIVVGGREEEGIDLVIPLEGIETVADMILDKGLNVIVELGTYKGMDDPTTQTQHKAAGKILQRINQKAEENLRSGNRKQIMVFADEVHMLAPERGSKLVKPRDEWVDLCNAELNTMATEGGNKGINLIGAFQRRSYTDKALVTQFDNLIVHRLGKKDRKDAASEIGVGTDEIGNLGTGQVFIYGNSTEHEPVGPQQVRLRRSPDPRQEAFEPPEPDSELSEVVSEIQEQVKDQVKKQRQKQDRVKQLEKKTDQLQEKLEEKEEELQNTKKLEKALDNLGEGNNDKAQATEEVKQKVEDLKQQKEKLRKDKQKEEQEKQELKTELEQAKERIEQLRQDYQEDSQAVHQLRNALQELLDVEKPEANMEMKEIESSEMKAIIEDTVQEEIDKKVSETSQLETSTPENVQEMILHDFQEKAISNLEEEVEEFTGKHYKLMAYLEAKGQGCNSMTALLREALGYENPGSNSRKWVKDLVEDGYMTKDKGGRIYPNLQEKVEKELEKYEVEDNQIEQVYQKLLQKIHAKA